MSRTFLETLDTPAVELRPVPPMNPQAHAPARPTAYLCTTGGRAQPLLTPPRKPPQKTEITSLFSILPEAAISFPSLARRWGYTTVLAHPDWAMAYVKSDPPQPIIHFTL